MVESLCYPYLSNFTCLHYTIFPFVVASTHCQRQTTKSQFVLDNLEPVKTRVSYKNKHTRITHPTYMLSLAYVGLASEVKSQATDDTKLLNLACKGLG